MSSSDGTLQTQCGSPLYVAPEVLLGQGYSLKVDMWSLGVVFYTMLAGFQPFLEDNKRDLYRKIKRAEYSFDNMYWEHISSEAQQFVSSLLCKEVRKRMNAKESLDAIWIGD